jgi:hypothetical protein
MGYHSDIAIAFAFKTREQIDEVLAVYQMHPLVQKHDLTKCWKVHDWDGMWGLTHQQDSVEWYDSYEDVQGLEHMQDVVATFADERGADVGETDENGKQEIVHLFPYAFRMVRLGEEIEDNEIQTNEAGGGRLADELYDRLNIRREIEIDF